MGLGIPVKGQLGLHEIRPEMEGGAQHSDVGFLSQVSGEPWD